MKPFILFIVTFLTSSLSIGEEVKSLELNGYWTSYQRSCQPLSLVETSSLSKKGGDSFFGITTLFLDVYSNKYIITYKNGVGCEAYGFGKHLIADKVYLYCDDKDRITEGYFKLEAGDRYRFDGKIVQQSKSGIFAGLGVDHFYADLQLTSGLLVLIKQKLSVCPKLTYEYFVPTPAS